MSLHCNSLLTTFGPWHTQETSFIRVPSPPSLLKLIEHGLANNSGPAILSFLKSGGPAHIFVLIRKVLPGLFKYLAAEHPWVYDIEEDDNNELAQHEPLFILLCPANGKLTLTTKKHPDGMLCALSKGRPGAGPKQWAIWLSTYLLLTL